MKRYLLILITLLFSLSACQQSPMEINAHFNEPEITTDATPEMAPLFNQAGLDRVIEYLQYSKQAFEMSEHFASLMREMAPLYDWKETKPYLRGGEQDPIGKLLTILAVDRFPNRAYEGLIQIVKDKKLLKQFVSFFTSDFFLEKYDKAILEAFSTKKPEDLETTIGALYKLAVEKFGSHYHLNSEWEEDAEHPEAYKLIKSGFSEAQILSLLVEVRITQKGDTTIIEAAPSKNIIFFTNLILKYYDLKRPRSEPKTEATTPAEEDDDEEDDNDSDKDEEESKPNKKYY